MSLNLDRSQWRRAHLGDVVRRSRQQLDPLEQGIGRYVAGGHVDGQSMTITRWGDPNDGQMGSTFRYVFRTGQILFVSARPNLRKCGVVDFGGVVADKTYVLDAVPERGLLQGFLPFVLASERFVAYATKEATGSMNPRLLWGPFQRYEFDLPPLDEQQRLADLLWAVERHRARIAAGRLAAESLASEIRSNAFGADNATVKAGTAFEITIGRQRSPKHETGEHVVNYLRSANVTLDGINVSDVKSMNFDPREQAKFGLCEGDVLVSEASASASAVGMPAVWRTDLPGIVCFQNTLLRYRAIDGVTLPAFVAQYCRWAYESGAFLEAAAGTSIRHIGVGGAASMNVPLPTLEDQLKLIDSVAELDRAAAALAFETTALLRARDAICSEIFGGN